MLTLKKGIYSGDVTCAKNINGIIACVTDYNMHSGNNGDFTSYFVMYKDLKRGFVFFTNCDGAGDLFDVLSPLFDNEH